MRMLLLATPLLSLSTGAHAEGDLSRADAIETVIEMDHLSEQQMYIEPNQFELERVKACKIVRKRTGQQRHELARLEINSRVLMRQIDVVGPDGNILAEVWGDVNEIEVAGGCVVEWLFVPAQIDQCGPYYQ